MMLSNLKIPQELRKKIDDELQPGERIRWVDQPIPRFFTTNSIGSFLFGIPWTSFALFWMWAAMGFQIPDPRNGLHAGHFFALFGLPFVLIGFLMLYTPVWGWQMARNTVYLITDRRAISFQGRRSTMIRTYLPDQFRDLYRKEISDGTGDVIIGIRQWKDSDGDQKREETGFFGIRNPRQVESLLRQLAQTSS